jgi:hypothetical protein
LQSKDRQSQSRRVNGVRGPAVSLFREKITATFQDIACDAALDTFESLPKPRRRDSQAVKRAVRAAIAYHWQKKPICLVQVITV